MQLADDGNARIRPHRCSVSLKEPPWRVDLPLAPDSSESNTPAARPMLGDGCLATVRARGVSADSGSESREPVLAGPDRC